MSISTNIIIVVKNLGPSIIQTAEMLMDSNKKAINQH